MPLHLLVHGTCVALKVDKGWRAVLLRGEPGSGKSDLAIRLIDAGARLVADDQTRLVKKSGTLMAVAPPPLRSLIEVRGLGIVKLKPAQTIARAPLALLVDLVAPKKIERMPDPETETLLGVAVPLVALSPFEASAPIKVRLALMKGDTA